jgi:hypothetical protein
MRLWLAEISGRVLDTHRAGAAIAISPDAMFRRATDLFIQRELKKTPLDVGADRIARTAYSVLRLLTDLRTKLAAPIPLAWTWAVSGIASDRGIPRSHTSCSQHPVKGLQEAGSS